MHVKRGPCLLIRLTASSAASCALLTSSCVIGTFHEHSARPQRPQRSPGVFNTPLCTLSPTLYPVLAPCLATLKWSTPLSQLTALWINHRPVDYSSSCGILYSPAHSLHAVRCRQRFSRLPLPMPWRLLTLPGIKTALKTDVFTDANRLFSSASRPLTLACT